MKENTGIGVEEKKRAFEKQDQQAHRGPLGRREESESGG